MKKIHTRVRAFQKKHKLEHALEVHILDLVSEVGELSKEILKSTQYGKKKPKLNAEMKSEFGDVFYSFIAVANYFGLNLEDLLNAVIKKYEERIKSGGKPGSENE